MSYPGINGNLTWPYYTMSPILNYTHHRDWKLHETSKGLMKMKKITKTAMVWHEVDRLDGSEVQHGDTVYL